MELKKNKSKFGILIKVLVLLVTMISVSIVCLSQKKQLANKINDQVDQMSLLATTFDEVEAIYKNEEANKEVIDNTVLGTEDNLGVEMMRKIIEKMDEILLVLDRVDERNKEIKGMFKTFPLSLVKKEPEVVAQTEKWVVEMKGLARYIKESSSLDIKATTAGYEVGVGVNSAIRQKADEKAMSSLRSKLDSLNDLYKQREKLKIDDLSQTNKDWHNKVVLEGKKDIEIFEEIYSAVQAKDIERIEKSLQALIAEAMAQARTGDTKRVSFWVENETVTFHKSLLNSWDKYKISLAK